MGARSWFARRRSPCSASSAFISKAVQPRTFAASFTHVSIAAVHAALSFYYQHKEALDEEDRMAAVAAGAFAGEHGHETL